MSLDGIDDLTAFKQLSHALGCLDLSQMGAHGMHGMGEWFNPSVVGI